MKFKIDPSLNNKKSESGLYLTLMFNNHFVQHLSGEERIKALTLWLENISDDDKKVDKENFLSYNSNEIGEHVDLPRINGQETDYIQMDMKDEYPVDEILAYYKKVMKLGDEYGVDFEILKATHFQFIYSIYDIDIFLIGHKRKFK
ncbi:MAG: hypothetical protein GX638_00345 [Crenarchaeota archaeon]|nr:hypothetical protein [Thermoproteota archaeon]